MQFGGAPSGEADPRLVDEGNPRVEGDSSRDNRALRQVQGVALSRSSGGVPRVGYQRGGSKSESAPPRLGSSGQLGKGGTFTSREGRLAHEAFGSGSRSDGEDPTTFGGRPSWRNKLRFLLEPREWFQAKDSPHPPLGGGGQRGRGGREGGDCDVEDTSGNLGGQAGREGARGEDYGCQDGSQEVSGEDPEGVVEYELRGSETDSEDEDWIEKREERTHMSPRQRAAEGHFARKRMVKKMNRSTATKLKDQAKQVCQIFLACSIALASHVGEVLAEPVADIYSVFTPSTQLLPGGDQEVQCLELFAGKARISEAFARRGRGVVAPRDIKFGHDFRNPETRAQVLQEIREFRPGLVWLAPPCTLWGNFSRLNYGFQELRRLRKREMGLIRFCDEVMQLQTSLGGGQFVLENPRASDMWRTPQLQSWIAGQGATLAKADLCSYGMRSVDGEHALRKPLSLLCSSPGFAGEIGRLCPKDHEHQPIQGVNTAHSGIYTTAFATAVVKAFDRSSNGRAVFPTATVKSPGTPKSSAAGVERIDPGTASTLGKDGEDEQAEHHGAAAITFKGKVNPLVASTLKRVRQNLGHPPNRELVRHLKIGGAPKAVLQAAEQMVCRTCERCSKTKPHKVATPVTALDFTMKWWQPILSGLMLLTQRTSLL